jgi:hypothetical protein
MLDISGLFCRIGNRTPNNNFIAPEYRVDENELYIFEE